MHPISPRRPTLALLIALLTGTSLPAGAEDLPAVTVGKPLESPVSAPTDACRADSVPVAASAPTPNARSEVALALDLLKSLAGQGQSNVAVSPYGVTEVLTALQLGADSRMTAAIAHVLHLEPAKGASAIDALRKDQRLLSVVGQNAHAPFATADGLFVDPAVKLAPGTADRVQAESGLKIERIDFSAAAGIEQVNHWVSDKTGGRIASILEPGSAPSFVAVNAFAFRDCWRFRFDPAATAQKPFHRLDGTTADVPTMALDEQTLPYATKGRFVALDLPYANGSFALTLVTTLDGPAAPAAFAPPADLLTGAALKPALVRLTLPKFTSAGEHDLLGLIAKLGLEAGLASPTAFSGFADGLRLSAFRQKTFITVDETGTEAAAATAATMSRGVEPGPTPIAVAFDRPFIYVLRHRTTGVILMSGYIAAPRM